MVMQGSGVGARGTDFVRLCLAGCTSADEHLDPVEDAREAEEEFVILAACSVEDAGRDECAQRRKTLAAGHPSEQATVGGHRLLTGCARRLKRRRETGLQTRLTP